MNKQGPPSSLLEENAALRRALQDAEGRLKQWQESPALPTDARAAGRAAENAMESQAQDWLSVEGRALEAAANAIVITTREGVIERVNGAFTAMTGYAAHEAVGRRAGELLKSGAHDSAFYRAMWETILAGRIWRGDLVNRRRDGSLYPEEMTITPLRNPSGEVTHFIAVKQDVSERTEAALKLGRANRALRMASLCSVALNRARTEDQLLEEVCRIAVAAGGYRMAWVGYAREDAAKSVSTVAQAGDGADYLEGLDLTWADDGPAGRGPAGRAIRNGEAVVVEDITQDDSFKPWLARALPHGYRGFICLPIRNRERAFGILCLYASVVARADPEEIDLLQEIADNLAFGIESIRARVDQQQTHAAVLKIATSVSAVSGSSFFDTLTAGLVDSVHADGGFFARLTDEGATVRTDSFFVDGRRSDNVSYALEDTPFETLAVCDNCILDRNALGIFPRTKMVTDLEVEAFTAVRLRATDGRSLGVLAVFFRKRIERPEFVTSTLRIFAASAVAEIERIAATARIAEQASLLDRAYDAITIRGVDERVLFWNKGAERVYGWTASEAVGRPFDELLSEDSVEYLAATDHLFHDGEWSGNLKMRHKSGRALSIATSWTLVRDESGRPKSILAIGTDMTERLAVEGQIKQAQHLEALGQLTGGVAHDFNNHLTVILGNTALLTEETADRPEVQELLEMTYAAATRAAELTHRLLAFSQRQPLAPAATNLNERIVGMQGLLRRTLSEDIEISYALDDSLWQTLVDPAELERALLNLCINARDVMTDGGKLTIETANAGLDEHYAELHPGVIPGEYVMVAVSDTGIGIPKENLERVFEPFFSTKPFGKGTGLGLSMVHGFVKQSEGHIKIYSEVGYGTTVKMYFPRSDQPEATVADDPISVSEFRGSERIVLVEDDDLVRRHAESQLRKLGYRVVSFENGADALATIRRDPNFDLLFTDVVMPGGISGPDLARAALAIRPGLRVLFASGYTQKAVLGAGPGYLLNKPYRRIDLARKVRWVLSEPSPGL